MVQDQQLIRNFTTPWKLRLWMARHLPMGLLSGMYIRELDQEGCEVVLRDRWWIRNPYGSVFWAVMGMAAELSTGALVYAFCQGSGVRFILVGMEGQFFKKVKGKSYYFCQTGSEVLRILDQLSNPNETSEVILPVTARDEAGQLLAEFKFRWQLRKPMN
jgi:hypothetical protein